MSDIKVFITSKEATCDGCQSELGRHAWITLTAESKANCLSCADLEHLVFLPAGDAALTRRSKARSSLSAVVLKWSRARKRYERRGLLVEAKAIEAAEIECLADDEARERRRQREQERRAVVDQRFVTDFAARVRELFPGCPPGREVAIAEHACLKYSGRVGRSAAAKDLDPEPVRLAVTAHVRHTETPYHSLLGQGFERADARQEVKRDVQRVLSKWERAARP